MIYLSSSEKTPNLRLNKWLGSDIPSRTDFVNDNIIIDTALNGHTKNSNIHITADERVKWDNAYYIGTFMGNGATTRNITPGISFVPRLGLIFPIDVLPTVSDFNNKVCYNYFALFSSRGSSAGVTLREDGITVEQSTTSIGNGNYKYFNDNSQAYVYILFR